MRPDPDPELKFFPGPYELEAGFLITRQPTGIGQPLLHLLPPKGCDTEAGFIVGGRDQHEATANLIAAAPELYEALSELYREDGNAIRGMALAGAALAKARGEQL